MNYIYRTKAQFVICGDLNTNYLIEDTKNNVRIPPTYIHLMLNEGFQVTSSMTDNMFIVFQVGRVLIIQFFCNVACQFPGFHNILAEKSILLWRHYTNK
jgi:hypothetical protein